MKKVLLSLMMCFLLVGCGNTLKCTMTEEGEGTSTYKYKFKDGKVVKATMEMKFEDKEAAKDMCEMFKEAQDEDNSTKVKCSGSKITLTTEDESLFEDETREELKEEHEEDGYKCN